MARTIKVNSVEDLSELNQAYFQLLQLAKKMITGPGAYNYKTVAVERMQLAIDEVESLLYEGKE